MDRLQELDLWVSEGIKDTLMQQVVQISLIMTKRICGMEAKYLTDKLLLNILNCIR